jgi:hypothetical protein
MPRLSTLSAQHLEVCDNTLKERGLIAPNRALLAAIIMKHPRLMRLLITGYSGSLILKWGPPSLDTYERGYLMDAIGLEYADAHWPCNMDGDEVMERFSEMLVERASQSGWVFTDPS